MSIKMKKLLKEVFVRNKTDDIVKGDTVVSLVPIKGYDKDGKKGTFTKGHRFVVSSVDDDYQTLSGYNLKDEDGGLAYSKPNQIKRIDR